MVRRRLTSELVRRGLAADEDAAVLLVASGLVTVSGASADNPGRLVGRDQPIEVVSTGRFVSRGGEKLEGALDDFALDVAGRTALDLGSSTGGFTDCLLRRGVGHVTTVDVGRALLHERIRSDARVRVRDGVHVRDVAGVVDLSPVDLVVSDLSFISACAAIDSTARAVAAPCDFVVLVKPQFEAPRLEADRGEGVVNDPLVVEAAVARVEACAERSGLQVRGRARSRLPGRRGNVEFFLHLHRPARF
jgi:23S rRNA (cytidine1920-2'-O)/16S rRNA (cytidine1409-2'-O)-methyltransferase